MKTTVLDDEGGQIILIPPGFELPSSLCRERDEAEVHWDGRYLVLTPILSRDGTKTGER